MTRKPYPADIRDEEWILVAPYLPLVAEDTSRRRSSLRKIFHVLRWIVLLLRLQGTHLITFTCLMFHQWIASLESS